MPERRYCRVGRGCVGCWRHRLRHAARRSGVAPSIGSVAWPIEAPDYPAWRVAYIRGEMERDIEDELARDRPPPPEPRQLERPDECPICLESMRRVGKPLRCGHWVHPACWRRAERAAPDAGCPLCRQAVGRAPDPVAAIRDAFVRGMSAYYAAWTEDASEAARFARHDLEHVVDWPAMRRKYNL